MADTEESLVAPSLLMKMGPWRYPFFLVDKICEFKRGSRGSKSRDNGNDVLPISESTTPSSIKTTWASLPIRRSCVSDCDGKTQRTRCM